MKCSILTSAGSTRTAALPARSRITGSSPKPQAASCDGRLRRGHERETCTGMLELIRGNWGRPYFTIHRAILWEEVTSVLRGCHRSLKQKP